MYKHILIPTDGSPLSPKAIEQGIGLARFLWAKGTRDRDAPAEHPDPRRRDLYLRPAVDLPLRVASSRQAARSAAAVHGLRLSAAEREGGSPRSSRPNAAPHSRLAARRADARTPRPAPGRNGLEAWEQVVAQGYEGFVAKDPASKYVAGRTFQWLKVKQPQYRVGERGWEPTR